MGLGADVTILDRSLSRLRQLDELFSGRVRTRYSTTAAIEEELPITDVVVGAVLVPGASAPKLVTGDMLKLMRPQSVLVDVAIDQGGCFETSRATTHADPTFEVDGVIHYCVANMPGSVPRTSSHALNNATLPYGLALADQGLSALLRDPGFLKGLNTRTGGVSPMPPSPMAKISCSAILGRPSRPDTSGARGRAAMARAKRLRERGIAPDWRTVAFRLPPPEPEQHGRRRASEVAHRSWAEQAGVADG